MSEFDYVVMAIRERIAGCDAHELGVVVAVDDRCVSLSGVVATERARRRVLEAARAAAPGHEVLDDLEVVVVAASPRPERLA